MRAIGESLTVAIPVFSGKPLSRVTDVANFTVSW